MDRRKALQKTGLLSAAAIGTPSLLAILQSCQSEAKLTWEPEFLTTDEARFISSLVDTILPKTSTPGALDVKVDMFLDRVFARTYDSDQQQKLKSAIKQFKDACTHRYGAVFADLSEDDRKEVLKIEESKGDKFNPSVWGTAVGEQKPIGFYRSIKSMAIWGYFTSEEIGEKVLSYDPIPTEYIGCLPVSEVGNKWSL